MARVASFPDSDTTLSCTLPDCTKYKPSVASPWAKIVFFFSKHNISLPFPIVERKEWGLNSLFFFALVVFLVKARPDWGARFQSWRKEGKSADQLCSLSLAAMFPLPGSRLLPRVPGCVQSTSGQKRGPDPGESDPETNFQMQ